MNWEKELNFVKKNKHVLTRLTIWSILVVLIPYLIGKALYTNLQYNFFSFYSFLIAAVVVYLITTWKTFKHAHPTHSDKILFWPLAILAGAIYIYLKYFAGLNETYTLLHIVIAMNTIYVILISLALFGRKIFSRTIDSVVFLFGSIYMFFIFTLISWEHWQLFSKTVTIASAKILSIFFDNVSYSLLGDHILMLNDFQIIIGPPCSGIESLSFFASLFVLMVILDYEKLHKWITFVIFFVGFIGSYILNIFRITTLMVIGNWWPNFAMGQFHSQAAWLLLSVFILGLYLVTKRHMYKKEHQHSKKGK